MKKMLRNISLLLVVVFTMLTVGCAEEKSEGKLLLPSVEDSSIAYKSGFGHHMKYVVEGNQDICVYSLNEDVVFLLITANEEGNQVPCYGDAFTKEIGGTPIGIANDLSSIIIENSDGKFEVSVSVRGKDKEEMSTSTVTRYEQNDDRTFVELYTE